MGQSVLVFISHSSADKATLIEPIVDDLERCYINTWLDKKSIVPGDNLRKSILKDGLDKADVVLIFFTQNSLSSAWVDSEIKHVLREEKKKGNSFDLRKIISIFDSKETYDIIAERYPELTDDLLHLMALPYDKIHLGQLISAIWSKYLALQGGDVATQKIMLDKDRVLFQRDVEIQQLKMQLVDALSSNHELSLKNEFQVFLDSGKIDDFILFKENILGEGEVQRVNVSNLSEATAFGLVTDVGNYGLVALTDKGKAFFKWYLLENPIKTHKNV